MTRRSFLAAVPDVQIRQPHIGDVEEARVGTLHSQSQIHVGDIGDERRGAERIELGQ